jgi:hypothetical protein
VLTKRCCLSPTATLWRGAFSSTASCWQDPLVQAPVHNMHFESAGNREQQAHQQLVLGALTQCDEQSKVKATQNISHRSESTSSGAGLLTSQACRTAALAFTSQPSQAHSTTQFPPPTVALSTSPSDSESNSDSVSRPVNCDADTALVLARLALTSSARSIASLHVSSKHTTGLLLA